MDGRILDAHLSLLDRQVIDPDGRMIGKVDDVELAYDAEGRLYCAAILMGPAALGPRMGGWLGRTVLRFHARWHIGREGPYRVSFDQVAVVDSAVRLLTHPARPALERWLREHVVDHIPGAGHDSNR
jgi:sporulation protein YlmC with PRC-barrel domain